MLDAGIAARLKTTAQEHGHCRYPVLMKLVLIGLLQGLGAWLLGAAALGWWLTAQYGLPLGDTVGVSLLVGGLCWVTIGLLVSALGCAREMRSIRRGAASLAPADGAHLVLTGVIEPAGALLRAPLDRSPCVAYRYEVLIDRGSGKKRSIVNIARGVGLAPSRIVTPSGTHKLLAVPDLEALESAASMEQRIKNFLAYAASTSFTEGQQSAAELLDRWADDDGSYRSDVRWLPTADADTTLWQARQQHVPPGAPVCLFGRYSQARGGIVPTGLKPVRLVCGLPAEVVASLRRKMLTRSSIAIVLGAIAAVLLTSFTGQAVRALGQ